MSAIYEIEILELMNQAVQGGNILGSDAQTGRKNESLLYISDHSHMLSSQTLIPMYVNG